MSKETSNVARLAGGAGVALAGRFSGRLISVLGNIFAARILGPALFGIYSIGWTIFRLVELVSPLGLDMGIIRYGALYRETNKEHFRGLIQDSLKTTFILSLLFSLLTYVFAPWIATNIFNKPELTLVLRFFSFGFPLTGIVAVFAATTRLTYDMKFSVVLQDFGQPFLSLFLLIIFFLAGAGLRGVLLSDLLSYGIVTMIGFSFLSKLFPGIFTKTIQKIRVAGFYGYSLFSSLTTITNTLIFWGDRLLVGYFLSASDTGIYQAASQISVLFAVVLASFSRIVTPMLASMHHQRQTIEMGEIYRVSTKWGIYICAPLFLVMLFSPDQILSVTYGSAFESGGVLMIILLIGQLFNLLTGPVGPLLVATGHQQFTFIVSGIALSINLLLNILLIPVLGLIGAALSTSVSLALLYTVELFAARHKLGLWPYDRRYWKGALSTLITGSIVFLLNIVESYNPFVMISVQLLVSYSVFFGTLLIFKLEEEDLELVRIFQSFLGTIKQ